MSKNKKFYEGKIPFDPFTDNPMYYPTRVWSYVDEGEDTERTERKDPVWKDNCIWNDELKYDSYYRGRSAAGMSFRSLRFGRIYTVFMTDFDDMVYLMKYGVIIGDFTFCKRGSNYGVRLVIE